MKKLFLIISTIILIFANNSCKESELDLYPPNLDNIKDINTETKLQELLNGAYLSISSANAYGGEIMMFGDILSDHLYVSNSNSSYLTTYNLNYNSTQNDFKFYGILYDVIGKCNLVINNNVVPSTDNVKRMKAEAKILRAFSFFTLTNFYSPSPTSNINKEYGVPLVLGNYDPTIQPSRASVAQVYEQIITDLKDGINDAVDSPSSKVILSKTAAKLILSKVYLSRRASGDAQLALQYATDIINNSPSDFGQVTKSNYVSYFSATNNAVSENQPETIWELDLSSDTNRVNGIGSNLALPCYYDRTDSRKCLLFSKWFYDSFPTTDIRKSLFVKTGVPTTDNPTGAWTTKYPRFTQEGLYYRNIKILRFSEALLNRIEALNLTGQSSVALIELNAFATSRGGSSYTGTNLTNDILSERQKEFFGEGQRFLDIKRYNLPLNKVSNCIMNCSVPANDKLFVFPMSQGAINSNVNLTQYPGYN